MVLEFNGMIDEDISNDVISVFINFVFNIMGMVILILVIDDYGNEIYWQVSNSVGDVVVFGGNVGVGLNNIGVGVGSFFVDVGVYGVNQIVVVEIFIDVMDCYIFIIIDFWGDGICCFYGNGFYEMVDYEGNVMFLGGFFVVFNLDDMEGEMVVGIEELMEVFEICMFFNLVQDQFIVDFSLEESSCLQMEVFNVIGQCVQQLFVINFVVGNNCV